MEKLPRIAATDKALDLVARLEETFGDLMFYQAGGCCEGTQPQCFEKDGFYLRLGDVCIGRIRGHEFWIDKDLYEYWKTSHFTLDVADGFGPGGFSLETPLGKTFKIHYRLFTDDEIPCLDDVKVNDQEE